MPSILKISDGTTTIDLLSLGTGFHLDTWTPAVAGLKAGGIYQDSDIAPGRELVYGQFDTANEVFNIHVNGQDQDDVIYQTQELLRLLQKARDYWLTSWQNTPVYIIAQASCETNIRYALIKNYQLASLTNPYAQPFFTASQIIGMNNLSLGLERGHWLSSIPGSGECAEISGVESDWLYNSIVTTVDSTPPFVWQFIQADNGDIFAAGRNAGNTLMEIRSSSDDGLTWATNYTGIDTGFWNGAFKDSNGNIYFMGFDGVWRSPDDGVTWTRTFTSQVYQEIAEADNDDLLGGGVGNIYRSTDDGVTWASIYALTSWNFRAMRKLPTGTLIAAANSATPIKASIFRSTDNGATWTQGQTFALGTTTIFAFSAVVGTDIYLFGANGSAYLTILKSSDDGQTFSVYNTTNFPKFSIGLYADFVQSQLDETVWYAYGYDGSASFRNVFKSIDLGLTWEKLYDTNVSTGSGVTNYGIFETSAGNLLNGGTDTERFDLSSTADLGQAATCDNQVYIANKQNVANLTDIKISDGGVFSDIFPASLPVTLFPAVPATNDALYFGINDSVLNNGPFSGLVFDLSTGGISTTSYAITWEYWNGAWTTLTTRDNTSQLSLTSIHSVDWAVPSDWVTTTIDSVSAYWVRARLSALTGTMTPPVQANRDIYATVIPYIDLASTVVLGDIPAISQIKIINQSDYDGPGGSAPNLYANRILIGLRSYDRGSNFQAYLNLSDTQNPAGMIISAGTNTTFEDNVQSPTGRYMLYNPTGAESVDTRATISLATAIARDFYGTFHAFLRAGRESGSAQTDFDIQLQVVSGSGGISFTTDSKQLETTTAYELLDFGQIKLPVAGSLSLAELGDITTINIQSSAASGTYNLYLYDLILIPVDEWVIDAVDKANESDSEIGRSGSIQKLLNVDSVTIPKYPIRTLVQQVGSNQVTSIYNAITPGEAILQANTHQRLWFLAAKTSATGTSYSWISPFEIVSSVSVYKNQRYLGLRGER